MNIAKMTLEWSLWHGTLQTGPIIYSVNVLGLLMVDGWIVKIIKPTKKDKVRNQKSFYSRKGFYAVSVQAIVDKKKRIIF